MLGIQNIQVNYAVALPLGHMVRVTWYVWKPTGLPRIVDEVTGVEYNPDALSSRTEDGSEVDRAELDPYLKVREELSGVVRKCVLWLAENGRVQTALTIEVQPGALPYR
jgi:hypothetical protein